RVDFKVAFKRNYKKMTTSLIFDIQNIMNRKNYSSDVFNESTQLIEQSTQVGLLPVISYKIEF
ncbi:MAG: chromosomal replication initiation ATPase DnaA, partial [Halioglobus sp.]